MHEMKHNVEKQLMNLLINRGRSRLNTYIRFKVALWEMTIKMSYVLKRTVDIIAAIALIFALSPVLVITVIAIKLDSVGAVIFKQQRVGKDGRHFDFFKFRSMKINSVLSDADRKAMNESKDGVIFKMKRDPRITRVGRVIRKFSIDELPQLFNVLIGDMSLVGPRPPLPKEVAQYTLEERKRLHVIPGITCIWQVSGRSDIPFRQQVELDKEYIKSRSLWKDFVILLRTIPAVLTGKGAY
jgi:lipopolysaccharide/colanic/teichoic acid biosynthesis glycosyltransferase